MELEDFIARGHARRAGGVENYFCILQRQRIYKNFALVTRFNKAVNDPALLSYALRSLLLSYPILASSIVTSDYSDLSVPRPEHDFVKVMDKIHLDDVMMTLPREILECDDHNRQLALLNDITWKYGDETPLWKLAFLDEQTLCYISNHCLSDGTTAKNLILKLEKLFNEAPADLVSQECLLNYAVDYNQIAKLPPPADKIIDYSPPLLSFLPSYLLNVKIIELLSYSKVVSNRSNTHSYRVIHIDPLTLSNMRSKLQNHGVTVTPFVLNAALNSMYQAILQNTWFGIMDVVIPCDARQFVPSGYDDTDSLTFGAITAGCRHWYPPIKNLSWKSILYTNRFFQMCKRTKLYLYGLGLLIADFTAKRQNLDKLIDAANMNKKRTGLVFSNIGVFHSMNTEAEYQIEDVIFSKNSQGTISTFSMSSCTTQNGMNLVLTMVDGTATQEEFDKIALVLEANIKSL